MDARDQKLSTSDLANRGDRSDATMPPAEMRDRSDAAKASAETRDRSDAAKTRDREEEVALLDGDQAGKLRTQWADIQNCFVDRPRDAVSQADELVAQTMQQLASRFSDERNSLERQWSSGDDISTEDLRVALQRYRSFFQRLLNA